MYTDKFLKLSDDSQVLCMLVLAELTKEGIAESEDYEFASKAMHDCWQWLEEKNISGDDLYYHAEHINDDDSEGGLFILEQWVEDPIELSIWKCISNALIYTARKAYEYEKERYMPQTIECVMEDTVDYFFDKFMLVNKDDKVIFDLFKTLDENKSKDILDIIEIVKRQFLQ